VRILYVSLWLWITSGILGPGKVELKVLVVGIGVFNASFKNDIVGNDQFSPDAKGADEKKE